MTSSRAFPPLFSIDGVTVRVAPVTSGHSRREAEISATLALIREQFGPEAQYLHTPSGEPYVAGRSEWISVSHSRSLCALAVSSGSPVGIDIEEWRPQLLRVAPKFLTPAEMHRYGTSPQALLRCWTAKEAAFKAAGIPDLTISRIDIDIEKGTACVSAPSKLFSVRFVDRWPHLLALVTPA